MRSTLLLLPFSLLLAQAPPPGWKEFTIGPATKNASRFNAREGLRAEGIPLRRAIARAWEIDEYLIEGPPWISTQRYAITALIKGEPQTFVPLFRNELRARFHIAAHLDQRDTAVYLLRASGEEHLHESDGKESLSQISAASAVVTNGTLASFAQQLSGALQKPVIDETGITGGRFDIELKWDHRNPASLAAALKEQTGLLLVEAQRPMEFLVIDRIEPLAP